MKIIYLLMVVIVVSACHGERRRLENEKRNWIGKTISMADTLQAKIFGRDTICEELFDKKYKVLIYIDSMGCSECKLQLYNWRELIISNRNLSDSLAFIFIVHTVNPRVVSILCEQNKFNYPIFLDKKGEMFKSNYFSGNMELQTFLLNKHNRVLGVGNPVNSLAIWRKYLDIIRH